MLGPGQAEVAQVDNTDRIALAIRDVGVLAESRAVIRHPLLAEIPPSHPAKDRQQNSDEKELAQGSVS